MKYYDVLLYHCICPVGGAEVMVTDQKNAYDFYTKKLGFEKSVFKTEHDSTYAEVSLPNSSFRISLVSPSSISNPKKRTLAKDRIGGSTGLWFYTKNIKKFYDFLKSNGVKVCPPQTQPWGEKQVEFLDQDNNGFVVFERL